MADEFGTMTPEEEQALLMYLFQNGLLQLPMNKYGEPEPIDLSAQGQGINVYQDIMTSTMDPAIAMDATAAGGGAYAPGAFEAQIDEFDPIKTPNADTLRYMSTLGGLEGWKAKALLDRKTPGQIQQMIKTAFEDPEGAAATGMPADVVAEIQSSLPRLSFNGVPGTEIDWNAVSKDISSTAMPFYQEQGMLQDPNIRQVNGRYFTEKPSAQMEWLRKNGLPDPRAQYDIDYMTQSDPDVAEQRAMADQLISAYNQDTKRYEGDMRTRDAYERDAPGRQRMAINAKTEAMKRFAEATTGSFQRLRDLAANPDPASIDNRPAFLGGPPTPEDIAQGRISGRDLQGGERIGLPSFTAPTQGPMAAGLENFWLPGGRDRTLQMAAPVGGNINRRKSEIRNLASKRAAGVESYALAKQLVPMLIAQQQGLTPYQTAKEARLAPLRQLGLVR